MAGTITTTAQTFCAPPAAILRAQLLALELMYAAERRCDTARRILDLMHAKRDELAALVLAQDRSELDTIRTRALVMVVA